MMRILEYHQHHAGLMSNRSPVLDMALMQRILKRDQGALAELYDQYGSLVYSFALRVVGSPGLAEEVAQDTFLKIWNQASTWNPDRGTLVTWMLTITRYTAIDRLRKEQRQPTDISVPLEDEQATSDDMPWQDNRIMRALLDQLPGEQQRVIDLAFYQGMTHSEMASYLSLPLGTVKTRLRLGLQKLRDLWLDSVNS